MKSVLIIGMGRFGRHIAMQLNELGHEVLAVDKAEQNIKAALPYVTGAQIGDGTDEGFLATLGVRNFDLCLVAIGDDFQSSLETTSLLKEMGAPFVVARAARSVHAKFLLRNGADEVVYPEKQVAEWAAIRYSSDHIFDYIELDSEHAIFEVSVPEKWEDSTIGELDVRRRFNINILAVKHEGVLDLDMRPDTRLPAGDTMLVIGSMKAIQKCFKI